MDGWEGSWTADLVLTDFTGSWSSYELGLLKLTQEAGNVTGTYAYNGGQIEGTVQGRQMNFRWWEFTAEGAPYESADPGNRGDGYFRISGDGQTLTGGWRYEGEEGWREYWPMQLAMRE
jgi:hypothetical protein